MAGAGAVRVATLVSASRTSLVSVWSLWDGLLVRGGGGAYLCFVHGEKRLTVYL